MGDLVLHDNSDVVKDTKDIQMLDANIQINECDSKIKRFRLDIEDVHKVRILDLEAKIKREEEKKKMYQTKLMRLQSIPAKGK